MEEMGWMTCKYTQEKCYNPDNECAWCDKKEEADNMTYQKERELIEQLVAQGPKTKATKAQIIDALGIALQQLKDQDVVIAEDSRMIDDYMEALNEKERAIESLNETISKARVLWKEEHAARLAAEKAPVSKKAPSKVPNSKTTTIATCECGAKLTPGVIKYCKENGKKVACLKCQREGQVNHKAPAAAKCSICDKGVSSAIVDFCNRKLDGTILCMSCQKAQKKVKAQG